RAGRNEEVPRREPAPAYFDRVRVDDDRTTAANLHAGELEEPFIDAVQPRDLAVLVGEQRRPVEARLARCPAVCSRDLDLLAIMRRVGKKLFRDAAQVHAGAAEAARLGDRHFCAVAGRDTASAHAARAGPEREKIEVEL